MLKYGIIGLGNLGEKIASNLINKGFSVKIFDKDKKNINKLVKIGAINSKSISEVANEVDGLITCLPSPKISTEVMAGVDGAILYMKSGSSWIETSTTDINELKKVSEIAKEKGIKTIEAPVTGGVHRAEKGIITVLVGADKQTFYEHERAIKTFGGKIFYLGDLGSASVLKVITNLLAFANLIGSIEGLVLAKKAGLDLTAYVFIVSEHSDHYSKFVEEANNCKSVLECHSITGGGSHILKVRVENSQALEDLLYEIQNWPGVSRTQSNLVLSTYKEETEIDLNLLSRK